jgi:hypothetical protein
VTPAEYRAFVAEVCASHEPGEAARIIEERCRPQLTIPPEFLDRHPRSRDHRTLAEQAGDAAGAAGDAA